MIKILKNKKLLSSAFILLMIVMTPKLSSGSEEQIYFSKHSSNSELIIHLSKLAKDTYYLNLAKEREFIPDEPVSKEDGDIISQDHMISVIDKGIHSVAAEWCGYMTRENGFLIFINKKKESGEWSEEQLKYIEALHSVTMDFFKPRFNNMPLCEEKHKKVIDRFFNKES